MTIARWIVLAIVPMVVAVRPVRAQSVDAEALFREGKRLLLDGKIREACEKLDASERLEPSVGTELNLADCRELNDQLATAWATFRKAATNAKRIGNDSKREAEARRRASLLERRLSYLTIVVPVETRVSGLAITRNGTQVDAELWNQKVPVDLGDYEVEARAPGHAAWHARISIRDEAKSGKLEVPVLDGANARARDAKPQPDVAVASEPARRRTEPARSVVVAPSERDDDGGTPRPSMLTTRRKLAIVAAAVGAIAIGGAGYLGSHSSDLETQSNVLCPTTKCTNANGVALNADARRDALFADVGFAVGGAAVAGGVVLWIFGAPRPARGELTIVPRLDGVGVVGHF